MDKKSPHYLKTTFEKGYYRNKGETVCERNLIVEGSDSDKVKEAVRYLSGRLL